VIKAVLVAGAIGAIALTLVSQFALASGTVAAVAAPSTSTTLLTGFAVGAAVQVGVRLVGVS